MSSLFNGKTELRIFTSLKRYDVKDLDMEFDILAHKRSQPNQATIKVYNMAESTRNLLEADHQGIEFYASKNEFDKPLMIFRGTTTNLLNQELEELDFLTTIFAGDGEKEFSTKTFNKAYIAGTLVFNVLKDVASAMGLPSEIDFLDVTSVLLRGESYAGLCKDVLDIITKDYGLKWSIQQGVLEITNLLSPIASQPTAVLLTSDSGLIGSPILIERQDEKQNTKKKQKKKTKIIGVRATSILNPEIRPGRLIYILAMQTISQLGKLMEVKQPNISANGVYVCDTAHYIGDNKGGRYDVELEADKMEVEIAA